MIPRIQLVSVPAFDWPLQEETAVSCDVFRQLSKERPPRSL